MSSGTALEARDPGPGELDVGKHGNGNTGGDVATAERLNAVYDVPVRLSAVLGKVSMPVAQLLRLGRGSVVELDRKVGEPVDVYVNNRLVARGEVTIVDDHLGITMTEIVRGE